MKLFFSDNIDLTYCVALTCKVNLSSLLVKPQILILLFGSLIPFLISNIAVAQVPQYLHHQGYLTKNSGIPLDTTLSMTFRLFNDSTGGTMVWEQTLNNVQVSKGVFNTTLGPISAPFDAQYWLEMQVAAEVLFPRTRITSVPYSFRADTANNISTSAALNINSLNISGNTQAKQGLKVGVDFGTGLQAGSITLLSNLSGGHPGYIHWKDNASGSDRGAFGVSGSLGEMVFIVGGKTYLSMGEVESGNLALQPTAGNVGIGTTSPSYKLDVNGTINATDILKNGSPLSTSQWTTSGNDIYYNLGNVGIGTASPGAKLDIATSTNPGVKITETSTDGGTRGLQVIYTGAAVGSAYAVEASSQGSSLYNVGLLANAVNASLVNSAIWVPENSGGVSIGYGYTVNPPNNGIIVSGNVGIGTASANYKLDVNGIINATDIYKNGSPFTGGSQWTTIDSNIYYNLGNVGIGTTSPGAKLDVSGNAQLRQGLKVGVDNGTGMQAGSIHLLSYMTGGNPADIKWKDTEGAATDKGRIYVSGSVGVMGFAVAGTNKLLLDEDGAIKIGPDNSNAKVAIGQPNGTTPTNILTVVQNSNTDPIAGAWTVYSSSRWKTNIKTIDGALAKIQSLRGVTYDWKANGKHDIGLVAEEVGKVIPEIVVYEENRVDARSVDYARLVALLIQAVKEQQRQIDQLKESLVQLGTGESSNLVQVKIKEKK